ncbi:MAG: hypothetical protein L0027_07220, partial [Candidatus Rokubacteria bacterium]|nr:hypothetical protein [Candidatus Rokubacteria bacterium]
PETTCTTKEAMAILGVGNPRLFAIAKAKGIRQYRRGARGRPGLWLASDVERMKDRRPGPGRPPKPKCEHPPKRLYAWTAAGVICVGCCECGAILAGGV